MDYRGLLLVSLVVGSSALLGVSSCSAPDPGAITYAERKTSGIGDTSSTSSSSSSSTSSSGGSTVDGGGDAAAVDPVFGTTTFTYTNPGQTANNANAAHAGTVEGKDCLTCHVAGGQAQNQPWAFGGTVYAAVGGGTTVAQAEIRVTGPTGVEYAKAYTDANGNFWVSMAGAIPANSRVGVRDGTRKKIMVATIAAGAGAACSSTACHGMANMRVFLN